MTPPTLTTTIHQIDVTKDNFFEVLNQVSPTTTRATLTSLTDQCQVWLGMVAYGVVIGWCTTWYTGTRVVIWSPTKNTMFVSDVLDMPLLAKDDRWEQEKDAER